MPSWKRTALTSAFAVALALIVGGWLWYLSRPKAWNSTAIMANLKAAETIDIPAGLVDRPPTEGGVDISPRIEEIIEFIIASEYFQNLPDTEKMKFLDSSFPGFKGLPQAEKMQFIKGILFDRVLVYRQAKLASKREPNPFYVVVLHFDITNTTDQDYTLAAPSGSMAPMQLQSGSLISAPGLTWDVATVTPYTAPAGFFEPKPILIPSHQTVRINFSFVVPYSPEIIKGKSPREVVIYALRGVDSFVLLDTDNHYRIELPLASFENVLK